MTATAIVGVGMTPFGRHQNTPLRALGAAAIGNALLDAGIDPSELDAVFVASTAAGVMTGQHSVVGQTVCSAAGLDGLPVYNVENACASSSTALNLATHAVASGAMRCVLVVGVEKLYSPDRSMTFRAINAAADVEWATATGVDLSSESVFMREVYPGRLHAYQQRHVLDSSVLAQIAVKNRAHAAFNPDAQYREPLTVEQVLQSRLVQAPITALMCSPIADGAAACIVASADRAQAAERPIWILASRVSMGSASPNDRSTVARVASRAYTDAEIRPSDVDVAEVHDATAFSELLAYEDLGFCQPGEGARLVTEGVTALGGRLPVNPSGGLESRGHPLGATGLAQIVELTLQLQGRAGDRQVPGARVGIAETAGGFVAGDSAAVAVTILADSPTRR